jgi:hypothetical protein
MPVALFVSIDRLRSLTSAGLDKEFTYCTPQYVFSTNEHLVRLGNYWDLKNFKFFWISRLFGYIPGTGTEYWCSLEQDWSRSRHVVVSITCKRTSFGLHQRHNRDVCVLLKIWIMKAPFWDQYSFHEAPALRFSSYDVHVDCWACWIWCYRYKDLQATVFAKHPQVFPAKVDKTILLSLKWLCCAYLSVVKQKTWFYYLAYTFSQWSLYLSMYIGLWRKMPPALKWAFGILFSRLVSCPSIHQIVNFLSI